MCPNSIYFGPLCIGSTLRPKYRLFGYMDPFAVNPIEPYTEPLQGTLKGTLFKHMDP